LCHSFFSFSRELSCKDKDKKAIPDYKFIEMQFTVNRYGSRELEAHHIIMKACEGREELMKESLALAKTFLKKRGILGEMEKRMYRDIIDVMDKIDPSESIEPLIIMIAD